LSQKAENLPVLEERLKLETDPRVRKVLLEATALIELADMAHPDRQVAAADALAKLNWIGGLDALAALMGSKSASTEAKLAATKATQSIRNYLSVVNFFGTIFRGLSLGSILLVSALGLAITFGLMGVINMAHGEMIAVGAYTTYVVENVFRDGLPLSPLGIRIVLPGLHLSGWLFQTYFIFAIPLSFLAAALAGLVLERLVIRFLYRRVLESLLATWGVSLIMQQLFRLVFGANNVQVNSPSWLLGNFTVSDVILGYNRIFVIAFAILIVVGTWMLLTKTPLGLFIRAVIQDRDMAACMGVPTERVNMLTFAFGSGLAGLAGAFLSQIGNVGPSLGQSYIIDSFMTVVVGGVGSIAGTVVAALGIGTSDQVLQQVLGSPVLGKIMVLAVIILFLQWKPGGFFPTRSRSLDG
jgi:urea transport system permease protein